MKKIAIIGKKNVGKSSLFNLLTRSNASVSINYSGYTRDINSDTIKLHSSVYEIIDTAGIGYEKFKIDHITLKKTWDSIKNADILLYVSEAGNFLTALEKNIINIIKNLRKKVIYIINKIDLYQNYNLHNNINKDNIFISVKKKIGINKLIYKILSFSVNLTNSNKDLNKFTLSVIGRTNVGKSTLVNSLLKENKMIVWNEPGTTRDNIKIYTTKNNKTYGIIDTPGIKKKIKTKIDKLYIEKSISSIKNSDLSILLIDINLLLTKLDNFLLNIKKTHSYIIAFNKCDLLKQSFLMKIENQLKNKIKFNYLFLSSKYGIGINRIFQKINNMKFKQEKKINRYNISNILNEVNQIKSIKIKSNYPLIINLYIKNKIKNEYKKYIHSLMSKYFNNNTMKINFMYF